MKDKDKNTFSVFDENGVEVKCEILFTFDSEETGKHYLIYTDNTEDEEGNTKTYASTFDPSKEESPLGAVETDKEWKMIEQILDNLQKKNEEANEQ